MPYGPARGLTLVPAAAGFATNANPHSPAAEANPGPSRPLRPLRPSLGPRPEQPVSEIPQARHDERPIVQPLVERRRVDLHLRVPVLEHLHAFRRRSGE